MADTKSPLGKIASAVKDSPVAGKVTDELKSYAKAKTTSMVGQLGSKLNDVTGQLNEAAENRGPLGKAGKAGPNSVAGVGRPGKGELCRTAARVEEEVKPRIGKGVDTSKRSTVIIEDLDIGGPRDVVYDQWPQFEESS